MERHSLRRWPPPSSPPCAEGPSPYVPSELVLDVIVEGETEVAEPAHRVHPSAILVLLPLRLFLAAGWLRAAAEKAITSQWWNGNDLRTFLVDERASALPFFRPVMEHLIAPHAQVVAIAVVLGEVACGMALATGRFMRSALAVGVAMNVVFVLCGRVNPSAFYLVMEIALLFAIADGTIGCKARKPSSRTLWGAGGWVAVGLVFVPYIRTMEPADVIADPAIMLAFLSFMTAAGLMFRWAAASSPSNSRVVSLFVRRADTWAHARHPSRAERRLQRGADRIR